MREIVWKIINAFTTQSSYMGIHRGVSILGLEQKISEFHSVYKYDAEVTYITTIREAAFILAHQC